MSKKKLIIPLENGNVIPDFCNGRLKFEQNYCRH